MNVGIAIKEARLRKKIKQVEAAQKACISQTYLSQIEGSQKVPSFEIIERLSKIYGVPMPVLLWLGTDEKDVEKKKRPIYNQIKPLIDVLINSIV